MQTLCCWAGLRQTRTKLTAASGMWFLLLVGLAWNLQRLMQTSFNVV